MDWPEYSKEEHEAIQMAQKLKQHCDRHKFPKDAMIAGVAIYGDYVKERSYINGVNFEKTRFKNILGL